LPHTPSIAASCLSSRPAPVPGQPALFDPATHTLILADLHFGHEVELLRDGIWVPSKAAERTARVVELLERTGAQRLVLNGDLKHLIPFSHRRERSELFNLFSTLMKLEVALEVVPGNHDGNLYSQLPPRTVVHLPEGCVISPHEWFRKALGKPGEPTESNGEDKGESKGEGQAEDTSKGYGEDQAEDTSKGKGEGQVEDTSKGKGEGQGDDKGNGKHDDNIQDKSSSDVDYLNKEDQAEDQGAEEAGSIGEHLRALCDSVTDDPGRSSATGLGLCHGHAWPSEEVMAQPVVVIGHNHPAVLLPTGLPGENHILPCWVRARFNDVARERYPGAYGELWLMPAFVEKAGRPVNRPGTMGMGPLLTNGFVDWDEAIVTTLEGVELGTVKELRESLKHKEPKEPREPMEPMEESGRGGSP